MRKVKAQEPEQISTSTITSAYRQLCFDAKIEPIAVPADLHEFMTNESMAEHDLSQRLTAALQVFIDLVLENQFEIEQVDKVLIDHFIAQIDQQLGAQLDEIIHHPQFQHYESIWRGLHYLIERTDFSANAKIELLDVDKDTLREDFDEVTDIAYSALYKHIYVQEYDTPGGEPITAMISNYEFNAEATDIALLRNIAKIASVAHCPFIASVGSQFFKKNTVDEIMCIEDLKNYMERAEFIRWNSFRESAEARYIGLALPRFLLRLPYGIHNPVKTFCYEEQVAGDDANNYCWGNASFTFAANMARSFKRYGWMVNICGPEAGGKVEHLPLHQYDIGCGLQTKIPTEVIVPETRELEFADLGFVPLSYYKNSDFACYFSANSIQKPALYSTPEATANARINARLPYIFLSSRLGHYLKVIQRENIGSNKNRLELESELNEWLQTLVTKMNKPGPELAATHPLREGHVIVEDVPDNPGFYRVTMYATPHFQIEGIDVRLSLIGQLPRTRDKQQIK